MPASRFPPVADTVPAPGAPAWSRLHPFSCDGFSLAPNQLLAAKLLALYWLERRARSGFEAPFLPFFEALAHPALADAWPLTLAAALFAAGTALLLNRAPRTCCAVLAAVIFADVLASRNHYANSTLFTGFLFALLALQTRDRGLWMLRTQMVLMYAGASLNKLLHPDWVSGQYVVFWVRDVMAVEWFVAAAAGVPGTAMYVAMSWSVIAAEATLAALFAVPRWFPAAAAVSAVFHLGMLFFTGGRISWVFAYAVGCALLALWRWPEPLTLPSWPRLDRTFANLLARAALPGARRGRGRGTPPWRWPVAYFALSAFFFVARRWWRFRG